MMEKKYIVELTETDKVTLNKILKNGNETVKRHKIAKVLLNTDSGLSDEEISKEVLISASSVKRYREKYVSGGLEKVFAKQFTPRLSRRKIKGDEEAQLITLCCSEAPEGYARWSLRLLADKVVELQILDEVCHSTIHQTLKKTNLSLG